MSERPTFLFLIADTGGGHRASANAVASEFADSVRGDVDIHIIDPVAHSNARLAQRSANLYGPVIQHARWLWGGIYHSTNTRFAVRALRSTILRSLEKTIGELCNELSPAVVVSFHPLLTHPAARALRRRGGTHVPLITVVTDLVDVHVAWACRDVDAMVTPSPGALDRARRAGIPASRCFQFGLPVHRDFTQPPPDAKGRRELRRTLGLSPEAFVVLLCGGADGSGGIDRRTRALAEAGLPVELVAICGRNQRVQQRLEGMRDKHGFPVHVHGFVNNMADFVRAADVIVTKAGPGTIAESLCCGTPLLLSWYLPGQERGNVEWVIDTGAGRYVPGIAQLVDTVAELASPGSPALARMHRAVKRVARPEASGEIADLILAFARGEHPVPAA